MGRFILYVGLVNESTQIVGKSTQVCQTTMGLRMQGLVDIQQWCRKVEKFEGASSKGGITAKTELLYPKNEGA